MPYNAYNVSDQKHVVKFINYFATYHDVPLPGRFPRMSDFTAMMLPSDITKGESTCPRLTMPNLERRGKIIWFIYTIYTLNKNCSFTRAFIVSTFSILLVRLFRMAKILIHNCVKFTEGYIMYSPMLDILIHNCFKFTEGYNMYIPMIDILMHNCFKFTEGYNMYIPMIDILMHNCVKFTEGYIMYIPMIDILMHNCFKFTEGYNMYIPMIDILMHNCFKFTKGTSCTSL